MNRAQMLYATNSIIELAKISDPDSESVIFIPSKQDLSDQEKIEDEYEMLGFFISMNPLEDHSTRLSQLNSTEDMTANLEGERVHIGGLITDLKIIRTKKGKEMAFLTIEDLKGRVEIVVFSNTYQRNKELFKKNNIIEVLGYLEIQTREINGEEKSTPKIKATRIQPIEVGKITNKIILYPTERDDFEKFCDIIKANPGQTKVEVNYHNIILKSEYKISCDSNVLKELEFNCRMEKIYQE